MLEQEVERKEQMILKPLFSKNLSKKRLFGFDIETHGDNNEFYMGGIFSEEEGYKAFYDKEKFIEEFIKNKTYYGNAYVVATNVGFDFTGLFYNTKYWNDFKIILSGSKMILASRKDKHLKQKISFIDTMNFVQFGVAKMGELLGLPKLDQPKALGRIPSNDEERRELEVYNKRDCEVTYYFMKFLQTSFFKLGGVTKLTIASTSMDIFRRKYLRYPIKKEKATLEREEINDLLFDSYYGGRTEVFTRGRIKKAKLYDINSLYPAVMRQHYPNPNTVRFNKKGDIITINEFEGVSKVSVTTPEKMRYPLLPFRDEKTKKLIFPLGTFTGTYTHFELRKAVSLGYKINKIYDQLYYKKIFYPFREFVIDMYEKRREYQKQGNPLELTVKIVMNSLYGKMASKHIHDTTFFNKAFMSDEELDTFKDLQDDILHSDKKELYMRDEDNGFLIEKKTCKSAFVFPILASYTTSYARCLLYDFLSKYNGLYCDTDSIVTYDEIPESSKLGAMKLEYDIIEGLLVKPKMYYFKVPVTKKFPSGEVIKLKGVPKTLLDNKTKQKRRLSIDDFENIIRGELVTYDKFAKLKESVRRNMIPNSVQEVCKKITLNDTKRIWSSSFNEFSQQDSIPITLDGSTQSTLGT